MAGEAKRNWIRLLALLLLASVAALGGWLGWRTHVPQPRLELSAEDELHPCFFSDDGSELVTEYVSRKGEGVQRGFIAWDAAAGREKERWGVRTEDMFESQLDVKRLAPKHRIISFRNNENHDEIRVFQVRPWKLLNQFSFDETNRIGEAKVSPSGDVLILEEDVFGGPDPMLELWDLKRGIKVATVDGRFLSFSPAGDRFATANERIVRFFRLPNGEPLGQLPALPEGESSAGGALDFWPRRDGTAYLRSSHQNQAASSYTVTRRFDIESGRCVWEHRDNPPVLAAPECDYILSYDPLGQCVCLFRLRDQAVPELVRSLGRAKLFFEQQPFALGRERGVLVFLGPSLREENAVFAWLIEHGWLWDTDPSKIDVMILNLRTGNEELRFHTALAANRFVLSPRGDLLACEAKVDPAAPAPRADTGEFPSFVQLWELPAAFPWLRIVLFGLLPPLAFLVAWTLVRRRWRRKAVAGTV